MVLLQRNNEFEFHAEDDNNSSGELVGDDSEDSFELYDMSFDEKLDDIDE